MEVNWEIPISSGSKKVIWFSAGSLPGKGQSHWPVILSPGVSQVTAIRSYGAGRMSWIQDSCWHFFRQTGASFFLITIQEVPQVETGLSMLELS